MIPRSISDCLNRLGSELDDLTLAFGTDGRIAQARAVRALDRAAVQETLAFWEEGVCPMLWKYEASLTVDSADSDRYELPPRTRAIINLFDDSSEYKPLDTMKTMGSGFAVEEGGRAVRLRNISSVEGTLKAWVMQEPARMTAGIVGTGTSATTLVLKSSPSIGNTMISADYYNGCRFGIISGTGAGCVSPVTDYARTSYTCTVTTWGTTPTVAGNSKYSLLLDVPDAAVDAVCLRAALIVSRTDQTMRDYLPDLREAYKLAHDRAIEVMDRSAITLVRTPLFVHSVTQDDTGEYS